ncbi:hypothetical protein SAMD00019534_125800 [Acytostelium subglobosum LB1]|uniref:hypothetical protein n=1 Tax=Acytostelium subglobosum LB1 TaxID=1410327 RepID=UPI00064513FD|nr:hypothetical protein SAMD00019534_125800 [Acytostelium subglobosum LB1]GAM29404.1 hypothetical protein SAMD00019534_125800 [Acytostelium subglobosum LB1]|eukprot:XP_012747647.1 hypothetical protein SAMD00019534_125800 [Acytostelium subglobosum LB1]
MWFVRVRERHGHYCWIRSSTYWFSQYKSVRVQVECFFGRFINIFNVFKSRYRMDHKHLDKDFYNCCMLANKIIDLNALSMVDHSFYRAVVYRRYLRRMRYEERRRKDKKLAARIRRGRNIRSHRPTQGESDESDPEPRPPPANVALNETADELVVNISNISNISNRSDNGYDDEDEEDNLLDGNSDEEEIDEDEANAFCDRSDDDEEDDDHGPFTGGDDDNSSSDEESERQQVIRPSPPERGTTTTTTSTNIYSRQYANKRARK